MLANVIFPAPSAAYLATLFFPVAAALALATEYGVYLHFQRKILSLWPLFCVVFIVNIFSWLAGILLSFVLPSFLVPTLVGEGTSRGTALLPGPHWEAVAILSFIWACLLSIALEYFALWLFRKTLRFRRLGLCVTIANTASYAAIGITAWVFLHFQLF